MKSIFKKIMKHPSLLDRPPVLVDIGASGALPRQWKLLAPYSICVAFDADTRDFVAEESTSSGWKKLYSLNRLVAERTTDNVDFYLTKSPHCSSTLQPDADALKPWEFNPLFQVEKTIKMPAVALRTALSKIGVDYIDWYKTDSQGTDLRIFDSLPVPMLEKIIAAEFEPGIIDAYVGEDKLHQLLSYMEKRPFWVSQMNIKGSQRIDRGELPGLKILPGKYVGSFLKTAPGWCEISYMNTLTTAEMSCREYLLAWVFSTVKGEHGFGLHAARNGAIKFQEPLFNELHDISRSALGSASGYIRLGATKLSWIISRCLR